MRQPTFRLLAFTPVLCVGLTCSITPAIAQVGDGLPSECALAKADAYSTAREAQGLSTFVTTDQLNEFEQQCETEERTAEPTADAPAIPPENQPIHEAAAAGRSLFTLPRVRQLWTARMPRGNGAAPSEIPQGPHRSASDGRIALTRVCQGSHVTLNDQSACAMNTAMLIDLPTSAVAVCWRTLGIGGAQWTWWSVSGDGTTIRDSTGTACPDDSSNIDPAMLARWRAAIASGTPVAPPPPTQLASSMRFDGHCNAFIVAGREWHDPGRCPGAVELELGEVRSNRPGASRLTLRAPARGSPVVVLQLDEAQQDYTNNDVITFSASPVSGLPFSWTVYDRLECTFVKSPADGMAASRPNISASATLGCSFQGNPVSDEGKFHLGFFADGTDVARIRAAFVEAFDRLNPGRPFVSPGPVAQVQQPVPVRRK